MSHPFQCSRCGGELESDDALSVVEGVCYRCRHGLGERPARPSLALAAWQTAAAASHTSPAGPREFAHAPAAAGVGMEGRGPAQRNDNPHAEGFSPEPQRPPINPPPPPFGPPKARGATQRRNSNRQPLLYQRPSQPLPGLDHATVADQVFGGGGRTRRRRDLKLGVGMGLLIVMGLIGYGVLAGWGRGGPTASIAAQSPLSKELQRPVRLQVKPAWALVQMDGQTLGPTDAFGRLTAPIPLDGPATRWIEITAPGYQADRRPVSAFAGTDEVLVELTPLPYTAVIRSTPAGADVCVDGQKRGVTPTEIELPADRPCELTLQQSGYQIFKRTLTRPADGGRLTLDAALAVAGPVLEVVTDPPGATVAIDGADQGISPLTLSLDAALLGREVRITAGKRGHAPAAETVRLPQVGEKAPLVRRMTLPPLRAIVEIDTDPPGGLVTLDGKAVGPAPAIVHFDADQAGRPLAVTAVKQEDYFGQEELSVPPAGQTRRATICMKYNPQRLLFILSCNESDPQTLSELRNALAEQIHRLQPRQRFALLAYTESGVCAWPGGLTAAAATSEQKVRAYDMLHAIRSTKPAGLPALLRVACEFEPTQVWFVTGHPVEEPVLDQFQRLAERFNPAVHFIRDGLTTGEEWLTAWASVRQGSVQVLGQEPPSVAVRSGEEVE